MNKKEIADIRKEFKEESYKLKVRELYSAYIKKDNGIIHKDITYFESKDLDSKELLYGNFKKILSSSIDTKFFELEFNTAAEGETSMQSVLYNIVEVKDQENLESSFDLIIQKFADIYKWDTDVVVNLIRAEYLKGNKKRNAEADEAPEDLMQAYSFVLCSINKVEIPKKVMTFDFSNRDFIPSSGVDAIINLNSPVEGFIFPAFENGYSNVNKVMYYNPKAGDLSNDFVEKILNCSPKLTAEDEKECFHNIITTVVGSKVKPETIAELYTKISEKSIELMEEEDGPATVGVEDIKKILVESGVKDVEHLDEIFEQNCGRNYDFKVNNVIPDLNSKSIKISNQNADINITPKDLSLVKQIRDKNGRKCLLIELTEDIIINGFELETEEE